ncbi:MAG: hypothetical protein JWR89_4886 [Tardiphaga sp.]|uniref:hypothetical protein n=1 Tax=Tardiphaga sp. TaxID=1926292 RepID=UPI002618F47E|nr:hypothetical protein [Tardiphaga sp.]MDB5504984.1 hypothetical protein [Tardiphaga sp.]
MTLVKEPVALVGAPTPLAGRGLLAFGAGAFAYLFFFFVGDNLLKDSDSFWQIKVGQWILQNYSVPHLDLYSFTRFHASWISTSWLSQVLYAAAFDLCGWAGPVILASLAIGAAIALFIMFLSARIDPARCFLVAMFVTLLSMDHLMARPHVLAMPVMVAWAAALIAAADRRAPPSFLWLPVMALWANLHGGFVLGLALVPAIALIAIWESAAEQRFNLAVRWAAFAVAALAASCCTPYGWRTLQGAFGILDLGRLLIVIWEWRPADFSSFSAFEAALLGLYGLAFYRGMVLSAPRIILLLSLVHVGLSHVRSVEVFAFLLPMVLARPFAEQIEANARSAGEATRLPRYIRKWAVLAVLVVTVASTVVYSRRHEFSFAQSHFPETAVDLLKKRGSKRIFNAYQFGGYLIAMGVPTFIDGRAELYGEQFVLDYFDAIEGRKVDELLRLLDGFQIDATLLAPASPAAQFLDHLNGWQRLYADDIAVIHIRRANLAP